MRPWATGRSIVSFEQGMKREQDDWEEQKSVFFYLSYALDTSKMNPDAGCRRALSSPFVVAAVGRLLIASWLLSEEFARLKSSVVS
jgi:hypothetical protein